jgi:hypothetical protein
MKKNVGPFVKNFCPIIYPTDAKIATLLEIRA